MLCEDCRGKKLDKLTNINNNSDSISSIPSQQVHKTDHTNEFAVLLNEREVDPIDAEDDDLLEELDAAGDAFLNEFRHTIPLSGVSPGMVDGKEVLIVIVNLPRGTPVSLPSTFQSSPESKKFPVMIDYGIVEPFGINLNSN